MLLQGGPHGGHRASQLASSHERHPSTATSAFGLAPRPPQLGGHGGGGAHPPAVCAFFNYICIAHLTYHDVLHWDAACDAQRWPMRKRLGASGHLQAARHGFIRNTSLQRLVEQRGRPSAADAHAGVKNAQLLGFNDMLLLHSRRVLGQAVASKDAVTKRICHAGVASSWHQPQHQYAAAQQPHQQPRHAQQPVPPAAPGFAAPAAAAPPAAVDVAAPPAQDDSLQQAAAAAAAAAAWQRPQRMTAEQQQVHKCFMTQGLQKIYPYPFQELEHSHAALCDLHVGARKTRFRQRSSSG